MRKIILSFLLVSNLLAIETCNVQICNKLSRFSLNIWSHIEDNLGETCWNGIVSKEDAVVGKVLNSESRWYQGSINPTKESVTKIKQVYSCTKEK